MENVGGFDFVEAVVPDSGNGVPAGALTELIKIHFLATPTGDDEVGLAADNLIGTDDAVRGAGLFA